jgi:hypothetical protein
MNAKQEFLNTTEHYKIICATVAISRSWYISTEFNLKPGYTEQEYQEFLTNLDFEYDSGYGGQQLFGTIWCEEGIWFDRGEYDGSEWWQFHQYPAIPSLEYWTDSVVVVAGEQEEEESWDDDTEYPE